MDLTSLCLPKTAPGNLHRTLGLQPVLHENHTLMPPLWKPPEADGATEMVHEAHRLSATAEKKKQGHTVMERRYTLLEARSGWTV